MPAEGMADWNRSLLALRKLSPQRKHKCPSVTMTYFGALSKFTAPTALVQSCLGPRLRADQRSEGELCTRCGTELQSPLEGPAPFRVRAVTEGRRGCFVVCSFEIKPRVERRGAPAPGRLHRLPPRPKMAPAPRPKMAASPGSAAKAPSGVGCPQWRRRGWN